MKTPEHKNIKTKNTIISNSKTIDSKKRKILPKSIRKYIRIQKAIVRKESIDKDKQTQLIRQLYQKFGY